MISLDSGHDSGSGRARIPCRPSSPIHPDAACSQPEESTRGDRADRPPVARRPAPTSSAIENELPTYRAISNRAVFSVICGVLASFSFADLTFLVFAVLAVVLGLMANVAIKRHPDLLTGRRLANAGIALGLIFGLTVITYTTVQNFILGREAAKFAAGIRQGPQGGELRRRAPLSRTARDEEGEDGRGGGEGIREDEGQGTGMADQRMAPLHEPPQGPRSEGRPSPLRRHREAGRGRKPGGPGPAISPRPSTRSKAPPPRARSDGTSTPWRSSRACPRAGTTTGGSRTSDSPISPSRSRATSKPVDDGHGHAPGGH